MAQLAGFELVTFQVLVQNNNHCATGNLRVAQVHNTDFFRWAIYNFPHLILTNF